jgi:hypothetical protein
MILPQVRKFAMSLADVTEEPHFQRTSFRVRGRIFVTADPLEPLIHVFDAETFRKLMLSRHPDSLQDLRWGKRIIGLRVSLSAADEELVNALVKKAWEENAAKVAGKPASKKKR